MKFKSPPFAAGFLLLGSVALLPAQTISDVPQPEIHSSSTSHLEGGDQKRFIPKPAPGSPGISPSEGISDTRADNKLYSYASQEASLDLLGSTPRSMDEVVDFGALQHPSPYRRSAVEAGTSSAEATATDLSGDLAEISAAYRAPRQLASEEGCPTIGLSIQQQVKLNPGKTLEIVEAEVAANSSCACEIVKAALLASGADATLTAKVVETAVTASPENLRLISQCAIAVVPEALSAVQAVLSKLEPNAGESGSSGKEVLSAKDSKDSKAPAAAPMAESLPNPLDLTNFAIIVPVPVIVTEVTDVNP